MELLGLSSTAWLAAVGIVVLGSLLQGSLGFGLGLITAPILVLLDPTLVPSVIIGMSVPLALLIAWRERSALEIKLVRWAIIGRVPGAIAGSVAVVLLNTRSLSIVFAFAILLAVALSTFGLTIRQTTSTMLGTGFVSGLMGTATSIGGPPMALVFQSRSGPELRAAMAAFMAFGSVTSLTLLAIVGEFDRRALGITALLAPATLAGFMISARTNRFLDNGYTRPAVLTVAAISALAILFRTL